MWNRFHDDYTRCFLATESQLVESIIQHRVIWFMSVGGPLFTTQPRHFHPFLGCLPDLSPDCSHVSCPGFGLLVPSVSTAILAWLNTCPGVAQTLAPWLVLACGALQSEKELARASQIISHTVAQVKWEKGHTNWPFTFYFPTSSNSQHFCVWLIITLLKTQNQFISTRGIMTMANIYPKKSPWLLFLPLNFEAALWWYTLLKNINEVYKLHSWITLVFTSQKGSSSVKRKSKQANVISTFL